MQTLTNLTDPNKTIVSANLIIPGIWLGNEAASQNSKFLRNAGINVIVNCTKHIPCKFGDITYYRLPINDPGNKADIKQTDNALMFKSLPELVKIIHDHQKSGQNILVHCHAGMQRSASVVAAYLAKYHSKDPEALAKVQKSIFYIIHRRPIAFNFGKHCNFNSALNYYMYYNL